MVRLDTLVAAILADARQRMEKNGAAVEAAPQVPRGTGRMAKSLAGGSSDRLSPRATVKRGSQPLAGGSLELE